MKNPSPAIQDYLKGIYTVAEEQGSAGADPVISTKSLADQMGVSAASATNMLKRLGSLGLVEHLPYRGARLTPAGRKIALEVIRHHRLLETYLSQALGVPWDKVHEEAEILEHVLSEDLEDRIAALLGHPTADPHGHPIPSKEGTMPEASEVLLWDIEDGREVRVDRVSDDVSEALRFLAEAGIRPGTTLQVVRRGPVNGPLFVRVSGSAEDEQALSRELAEAVWVA